MKPGIGAVVVGTSYGVLSHVHALRDAGFEVLALVGRDPVKAETRAHKLDVRHGLTNLHDALALERAQVVAVATPPHTHAEIARGGGGRKTCLVREALRARPVRGPSRTRPRNTQAWSISWVWSTASALPRSRCGGSWLPA